MRSEFKSQQTLLGGTPARELNILEPNNLFLTPMRSETKENLSIQGVTYEERIKKQDKFNDISERIYGYLIGCLGTEPIKRIRNHNVQAGDGTKAWKVLEKEYQAGSKTNRSKLIQQLTNLKMAGP